MILQSPDRQEYVLFFVLLCTMMLFANLYGWNEYTRMDLSKAIVEDRSLAITPYHNNTGDKIRFDGDYYTDKPPLSSFIGVPAYILSTVYSPHPSGYYPLGGVDHWETPLHKRAVPETLFHFLFTVFTATLPGVFLVFLIKRKVESEYSRGIGLFTAAGFGVGTLLFIYSTHSVGVVLAALFAYLSYLYAIESKGRRNLIISGIFGGLAVATEYYAALVPIILFAYLLYYERESARWYAFGGLLGISPLLIYNYAISGLHPLLLQESPFQAGNNLDLFGSPAAGSDLDYFNETRPVPQTSLEAHLQTQLDAAPPTTLLIERILRRSGTVLKLSVYPVRGLFFYSPILLLSIVGIWSCRKSPHWKETGLIPAAVLIMYLLFNVALKGWWSGGSYGPRYLVLTIPFLALPFAHTITRVRWHQAATGLLAVSLFQNLVGSRGQIFWHGSPATRQISIEPDHLIYLIEAGHISLSRILLLLHPHSWNNYVAHAAGFIVEGPPMMVVTTWFGSGPWDIRLPRLPPEPLNIPLWATDHGIVMVSGGWITFSILVLGLGVLYVQQLRKLWQEHPSARIALLIILAAIIVLPVHLSDTSPHRDPWSFYGGSLYLGEVPVRLSNTYQPEKWGVWLPADGKLTLKLTGDEQALALDMRPITELENTSFHIALNGRTLHNDTLPGSLLIAQITAQPGRNTLTITSPDGCVTRIDDMRCRALLLHEIRTTGFPAWNTTAFPVTSYWPTDSVGIWVGVRGEIALSLYENQTRVSLDLDTPRDFNPSLRIGFNNRTVYQGNVPEDNVVFDTAPAPGLNTLTIESRDGCVSSEQDSRCRSVLIRDILTR